MVLLVDNVENLWTFVQSSLPIVPYNIRCSICDRESVNIYLVKDFSTGYPAQCCKDCFISNNRFHTKETYRTAICSNCGDKFDLCDFQFLRGEGWLCLSCYNEHFWQCDGCYNIFQDTITHGNVTRPSGIQLILCSNCYGSGSYLIHNYSYDPQFKFYKTEKDKRNLLYYGIELEVESMGNKKEDILKQMPDFVYVKHDGSLTDGFEVVSHPATYSWLKANEDKWNNILDIRKYGYCSYLTARCDMHIHLSKAAFTPFQLHKFMVFINRNPRFSNRVGQKTEENSNPQRFRQMYSEKNRRLVAKAKYGTNLHDERYVAVNLNREHTVEVRIFKGTLSPTYFWKNIEFTNLLYDFSLNCALPQMKSVYFRKYLNPRQKEYPNLYSFLYPNDVRFSLTEKASKKTEIIENV